MMIMTGMVVAPPGSMVEGNARERRILTGRRRRRGKGTGIGHQNIRTIGMPIRMIGGRIGIERAVRKERAAGRERERFRVRSILLGEIGRAPRLPCAWRRKEKGVLPCTERIPERNVERMRTGYMMSGLRR
jgi:hypothetical protein